MALRQSVQAQMERIRLKREELDLRIKKDETTRKLAEVKAKIKANGGRVR